MYSLSNLDLRKTYKIAHCEVVPSNSLWPPMSKHE